MCSWIRLINKTLTNLKKVCMVGWQVSITTDNLLFRVLADTQPNKDAVEPPVTDHPKCKKFATFRLQYM